MLRRPAPAPAGAGTAARHIAGPSSLSWRGRLPPLRSEVTNECIHGDTRRLQGAREPLQQHRQFKVTGNLPSRRVRAGAIVAACPRNLLLPGHPREGRRAGSGVMG